MKYRCFTVPGENMMGNSLHNKIYLGRASALASARVRAALVVGACVSIGLMWLVLRSLP